MPDLVLLKGPLSPEHLQAVAALYGVTDGKYGSVEHCQLLFNRSPFGPTLHAFARDQDKFVGHYCLIPYDLVVDGRQVKAAKGEALHVDSAYRRTECDGLPTSSALLEGAQRLAVQEGIEVSYAIVAAPGVIRLFGRCGYVHSPFQVTDQIVPQSRALPLPRLVALKAVETTARLSSSAALQEVDFAAIRTRLPVERARPAGWQPAMGLEVMEWFGQAPSNRYFQLGEGVVWLAQTHSDWEVLCTLTAGSSPAERTRLAIELRREATRRDIDRIRVPHLEGIEPEMLTAFGRLARRELEREVSLVVRSELTLGRAAPVPFLWSHF
ncbi:MAG: GNAT family N-acetyltransferase [Candidatus Eremiobacteraeota bacterium]|nr:GNAT family N-acetyltransferase [Candidatus Eremiobacteraeota bacterium]